MPAMRRIYLDNAATSWPKPESVYAAVDAYQRQCGAAAGRGAYGSAQQAAQLVQRARTGVATLLGGIDPRRIAWTLNATDALNQAIHGWVGPGQHVVTTDIEHNSVLRPLHALSTDRAVSVDYASCDETGLVSVDAIRAALRPDTRLLVVNHASNVTGALQPLESIAELARERRVPLLVDVAQTLGQIPWSLPFDQPLLVAGAGHKSLLAPLGVGFLAMSDDVAAQLRPQRQGGTGTQSEDESQPTSLPDRFESGNLNVPGLAGLASGIDEILARGVASIATHHAQLAATLRESLAAIPGVQVLGPTLAEQSVGVVSITSDEYEPQDLSAILDTSFGIETRAGLHCAPRIHRRLGTLARGGTLRFSVGFATTADDIAAAANAVGESCP